MNVDYTQEGVPYQSVPTYSDPYQDILSEDAVIFAPGNADNRSGNEDQASTAVAGAASAVAKPSPARSLRSSSNDRLERGERDPLLSTGTSKSGTVLQMPRLQIFAIHLIPSPPNIFHFLPFSSLYSISFRT